MSERQDQQVDQVPDERERKWTISRRGFLIGMAATGAALALGIPLGLPVLRRAAAGLTEGDAGGFASGTLDPLLWFEVYPDDRVLVFVPKAEMGQGIHTALAQIAAEELEVAWERLEVLHASTSQADDNFRGTSGSMSVTTLYDPLRQAAATLREMLRTEAARMLNQPVDALVARDGGFELAGRSPDPRDLWGAGSARRGVAGAGRGGAAQAAQRVQVHRPILSRASICPARSPARRSLATMLAPKACSMARPSTGRRSRPRCSRRGRARRRGCPAWSRW